MDTIRLLNLTSILFLKLIMFFTMICICDSADQTTKTRLAMYVCFFRENTMFLHKRNEKQTKINGLSPFDKPKAGKLST